MRYLLDTNTCIYLLRNHPVIVGHLERLPKAARLFASLIAQGEMLYGVHRAPSPRRARLLAEVVDLLQDMGDVLPVTPAVAETYGRLKSELATQGTPIPSNDTWAAAIAIEAGLVLVSDDAHFRHVPGLILENWLE